MRKLIRSPLTWMIVAEFVVVGALLVLAWNAVGTAARQAVALPGIATPEAAPEDTSLADLPSATSQASRGPLPALNLSPAFWRERLAELNRDEAWAVAIQWRVIHSGMDAARTYLETVVLPAIRRAEVGLS